MQTDIIRLLSDHLANQIAAGEVIQRPASAVKELMENAVDAGATEVTLVLKDAGKELVQVIDNGSGMSPTDARMSFERHATSKIRDINDLFAIRTMGFRGEALASIAAVAQVEMRTRQRDIPVGTRLVIEGTEVISQEPAVTPEGTNILVKNLFFNVPARRHFLKSNTTELRHIIDEFTRVTMPKPRVAFRMLHNGTEQFRLEAGNLKTRIVGLLGASYEKNLVPVDEDTEVVRIHGFIGKPEAATRTRGNQLFFINNRFIRNPYLHHAVVSAYESLLEKDTIPFYVLFLETDPARVDVNVHPTKQEVKFEDDRLMYAFLNAAVKHALARYNISPSLDFTLNAGIQSLPSVQLPQNNKERNAAQSGYLQNEFSGGNAAHKLAPSGDLSRWQEAYREAAPDAASIAASFLAQAPPPAQMAMVMKETNAQAGAAPVTGSTVLMVQGAMLITTVKSGAMLLHLRRAQERIWYERLMARAAGTEAPSQRILFPISVEVPPADAVLLHEALPQLRLMGFDIAPFGAATFVLNGTPPELPAGMEKRMIETIADSLKHAGSVQLRQEFLSKALARQLSFATPPSTPDGQQALIDELFSCAQPEWTPDGKKVFTIVSREGLEDLLR